MPPSQKFRLAFLVVALVATVGCDQTSKHLARNGLSDGGVMLPGGFGELRLAENPGSFLSVGDSLPERWRQIFFTASVGVGLAGLLAYLALGRGPTWLSFVGLALAWAGGMSNLIDRIMRRGLVSDFIFLRAGPLHTGIFNLADVVIMTGFAVLLFDLWKRRQRRSSVQ